MARVQRFNQSLLTYRDVLCTGETECYYYCTAQTYAPHLLRLLHITRYIQKKLTGKQAGRHDLDAE